MGLSLTRDRPCWPPKLACAGAVLCCLGFGLGFHNGFARPPGAVLLFPLGTLCIVRSSRSWWSCAGWSCLAGSMAAVAPLLWLRLPSQLHGGDVAHLAWLLPVVAAFGHGLYLALYALLARLAYRHAGPVLFGLQAGLLWVAMEMAKSAWCKFPLLTVTAGLSAWPWLVQGCALVGSQGLAGAYVACLAWLVVSKGHKAPLFLATGVLCVLGLFTFKALTTEPPAAPTVSIACIQGYSPIDLNWEESKQIQAIERYREMTLEGVAGRPFDVVLWPETALPLFFRSVDPLSERVQDVARIQGLTLLFGALSPGMAGERRVIYNRAILLGPNGRVAGIYEKQRLVPIGEYVPRWFRALPRLVAGTTDLEPGQRTSPLTIGSIRSGVLICFESLFAYISQKHVENGANLLVNLSNDIWFAGSAEPRQHLDHAVLRAVEQGRYLVRATNSGITALVDPAGRVLAQGPMDQAACVVFERVPLLRETTAYHSLAPWVGPGVVAGASLVSLWTAVKALRRRWRG